jgi:hypothetical protein
MVICRLGVVAVLIVACAGCATGQREADSTAAASGFLTAMGDDDMPAACALLATKTREELEYSESEPCATSLKSVDIAGGTVGAVAVWGGRAQARTSTGTLFLVELDAGWRVTAAGCTRAPDGTYDCLLGA